MQQAMNRIECASDFQAELRHIIAVGDFGAFELEQIGITPIDPRRHADGSGITGLSHQLKFARAQIARGVTEILNGLLQMGGDFASAGSDFLLRQRIADGWQVGVGAGVRADGDTGRPGEGNHFVPVEVQPLGRLTAVAGVAERLIAELGGHKNSRRNTIALQDGQGLGQVVEIAVVEGHGEQRFAQGPGLNRPQPVFEADHFVRRQLLHLLGKTRGRYCELVIGGQMRDTVIHQHAKTRAQGVAKLGVRQQGSGKQTAHDLLRRGDSRRLRL